MQKLSDKNRLSVKFCHLCEEWSKKNTMKPNEVSFGSHKKVWWKCKNGHEWEARIKDRTRQNQGCPYCSGKRVLKEKSAGFLFSNLQAETKENLFDFLPGSGKKVWWKCKNGHEWKTEIRLRTNGHKCPFCVGNLPTKETSLEANHLELLEEFDYEKNDVLPSQLKSQSNRKVWWKCKKGHSWETYVYNRTLYNSSCPYCSHNMISYENSLEAKFPELLEEFDYEKNDVTPSEIFPSSHKKIWWKCENGHSWEAYPYNRTKHKTLCPVCRISIPQKEVSKYVETLTKNFQKNDRTILDGKELDIFIPEKNFAIEYNGLYWHSELYKEKKYHRLKTEACRKKGIQLFHIFSDEWVNKKDIVKSMIKHRLGISNRIFYARQCKIEVVKSKDAREFYDKTHISGFVPARHHLAITYKDEIIAMLSLRKPVQKKYGNILEISRFSTATNTSVVGGFSRLLKHAIKYGKENDFAGILSYADLRFGEGKVYEKMGFDFLGKSPVGYWYTDGEKREFRFRYRAQPGKTEKQVAEENNVLKIYDCGSNTYLLKF